MEKTIKELLRDKNTLIEKINKINVEDINCSYSYSEIAYLKWNNVKEVKEEEAFISFLAKWIEVQSLRNKEIKSTGELLTELFSSEDFLSLTVEKVDDSSILNKINNITITDFKELQSFKKAKIIKIYSIENKGVFFGKCSKFYFMISEAYFKIYALTIHKDILDLLFQNEQHANVRKRPGMYIGSVNFTGLHRMVFDLVIEILTDSTEKEMEINILSQDTIEIFCGSYNIKDNTHPYSFWLVVNGLSEYFLFQDSQYVLRTEKGELKFKEANKEEFSGVKAVFKIDKEIFKDLKLNYFWFLNNFMELAALNPFKIILSDDDNKNIISMPEGVKSLLMMKNICLGRALNFKFSTEELEYEVVLHSSRYTTKFQKSYVNNYLTIDGGTHVDGMLKGVNSAILKYYNNDKEKKKSRSYLLKNLDYIVSIKMKNPRYAGVVKDRIENLEIVKIIEENVSNWLYSEFQKDSELIEEI